MLISRRLSVGVALWLCALAGAASQDTSQGRWLAGDLHNHSCLTDGSYPPKVVMEKALTEFGLDWMVNSEHGGAFGRDPAGRFWEDPAISPPTVFRGDLKTDKNKRRQMWRWQSLCEYSYPAVAEARKSSQLAGKTIMQGLEFNCPGHEHASVGILADSGLPIAEFEYRFDGSDEDTSGGPAGAWKGKVTANNHAKALQAIQWLQKNHGNRSWFIVNHPERRGRYSLADLREFNDTAPGVAFGFEGMPGHQRSAARGGYGEQSFRYADNRMGGTTYGGTGVLVARVGGGWDAMLGEGRRFFAFADSDFHSDKNDYFPGQYQKTYVKIGGPVSEQAILDALRAGRSFFTSGDLVDALELTASTGRRAKASRPGVAGMGEQLELKAGSELVVNVRWHDPAGQNRVGDAVAVHHVDLITGEISGPIPRLKKEGSVAATNPAYAGELNPSARVATRFEAGTWKNEGDGWFSASYTMPRVDTSLYLRLRGTNLPPGTPGQTDAAGNPLSDDPDTRPGRDGQTEARADLWFYSNPVYVRVH